MNDSVAHTGTTVDPDFHLFQRFLSELPYYPSAFAAALDIATEAGSPPATLFVALHRFRHLHASGVAFDTYQSPAYLDPFTDQPHLIPITEAARLLGTTLQTIHRLQRTTGELRPDALRATPGRGQRTQQLFFKDRILARATQDMLTLPDFVALLGIGLDTAEQWLRAGVLFPDQVTPRGTPLFSRSRLGHLVLDDETRLLRNLGMLTKKQAANLLGISLEDLNHKLLQGELLPDRIVSSLGTFFSQEHIHGRLYKHYLRFFEAAAVLEVSPAVLQTWIDNHSLLPDAHTAAGQPLFSEKKLTLFRTALRKRQATRTHPRTTPPHYRRPLVPPLSRRYYKDRRWGRRGTHKHRPSSGNKPGSPSATYRRRR